jgi:hypothetical protein
MNKVGKATSNGRSDYSFCGISQPQQAAKDLEQEVFIETPGQPPEGGAVAYQGSSIIPTPET